MNSFSGPKLFILVSTVMTWASSKPLDPVSEHVPPDTLECYFSGCRTLVVVWKQDEPELPLTDEIFWSRRAHPSFLQHIELERTVVRLGKTVRLDFSCDYFCMWAAGCVSDFKAFSGLCFQNRALLSTYVVASGLQYGMGEQILHHFFKVRSDKQLCSFADRELDKQRLLLDTVSTNSNPQTMAAKVLNKLLECFLPLLFTTR